MAKLTVEFGTGKGAAGDGQESSASVRNVAEVGAGGHGEVDAVEVGQRGRSRGGEGRGGGTGGQSQEGEEVFGHCKCDSLVNLFAFEQVFVRTVLRRSRISPVYVFRLFFFFQLHGLPDFGRTSSLSGLRPVE